MKKLIIKDTLPKHLPCLVRDFDEEYKIYLRTANKHWKTPEGFSLEFDSTLQDLLKSYFVYVDNKDLELTLKKRLKVIEEI